MNITTVVDGGVRPYEMQDDTQLSIVYERDLSLYRIDREVYSIFDWMSDVGGLYEFTKIICFILLSVVRFASFENFLVSQLFVKIPEPSLSDKDKDKDKDKDEENSMEMSYSLTSKPSESEIKTEKLDIS